jgi:gp16 family phage-associated protein
MTMPLTHPTLRTPSEVLDHFHATGVTVAGWCRQNGFSRSVVNALLHRNAPGLRGESHRAAIALGLKADPAKNQPMARVITPDATTNGLGYAQGAC